jgi:hypothetical protein
VIELDAIELILKGVHGVAVGLHLVVMATRVLRDLVNHELRISPDVEALDTYLDGNLEAAEEGLVLRHIVGHGEMQMYRVPHMFLEGRDEEQACARPRLHH